MTDTAAPTPTTLDWIKTLGPFVLPILIPLVTFLTGVGTTVLAHHLTRVDKIEEKHQGKLDVPLVRLGDIEDVVRPLCAGLDQRLAAIQSSLPAAPAPARAPRRAPAAVPVPR